VALVGLVLAVAGGGVVRWLGTAAVLAAAPLPWRVLVAQPWWQRWWQARRGRLPGVLIVALVVVLLGPLLRGEPPASRDHGIHYFQVHLLVNELLPSGRLWGWSPSLNHGYPYGESYPVLGYLWMAAAHLVSFGAVSLRTSYAWGLAALWMLSAAVAWSLAATIARELRPAGSPLDASAPSRTPADAAGWAGLVAAALWLLDPGGSRQGGWSYLLFHGVWPQLLAATLWAASLGATWRAMGDPRPRRLALAVLTLGGSLWAHPFGLLTAAASAAAWAVLVLVGAPWRSAAEPGAAAPRWPGPWRVWAVVHGGGALLGMGWLATFFGGADAMGRQPVPWAPLADLGAALVHGGLLAGHWAVAIPLALVGGACVVRRGGALGWAVLGLGVALLVLGSDEAITVLRLDLVLAGFKNLQFPRYAIPLKPLLFALAGVGVAGAVTWLGGRRREPAPLRSDAAAWVRRGAVGLLFAPLVASLVPEAGRLGPRPVGALDTLHTDGLAEAEAELLAVLRHEAAALPPERPLCVAFMRSEMGGGTYPIYTVTDAGGRLAIDAHIPTVNLEHVLRRRVAAYASLGVTHVIHDRPVPEKETELLASLETVGEYGPFTLDRFTPPPGHTRRVAELLGDGTLAVRADETERLELEVMDVRPGTTLALGRAPHHRWVVTLDGAPLDTRALRLDRGGLMGLGVDLPGPGRVVVEYQVTARERRAVAVSAVVLLLCLVGLVWSGPPLATAEPGPRARRVAWGVAGAGALLLAVAVPRRQAERLAATWQEMASHVLRARDEGSPAFVRDLVEDDALAVAVAPARICSGLLGKDVRDGCSETAHAPSRSFLYREPHMYRCLRLSIPPDGEATLDFPALPDDAHVVVGVIVRHDPTVPGRRLSFGSRSQQPLTDEPRDFMLDRRRHGAEPSLTVRNAGRGIEQVCVAAALVRRP
jgi:hypothetical protein